jgi:hypothetical protein
LKQDAKVGYMLDISAVVAGRVEGIKLGHTIPSQDGKFIYHVSIIDYLQRYNLKKKFERCLKITFYGAAPEELSAINVSKYRSRFLSFMKDKVFNYEFNHKLVTAVQNLQKMPTDVSEPRRHTSTTSQDDNILFKAAKKKFLIQDEESDE